MNKYKFIIVGASAAGMMAAVAACEAGMKGSDILILDHNEKVGKKMFITGKGRCNLTNNCDADTFFKSVRSNSKFMYSAFYTFDNSAVMDFFEKNGCPLKVERGDRVFPVSDKSGDVIDALKRAVKSLGVEVRLHTHVKNIRVKDGRACSVITAGGEVEAEAILLATGGLSYQSTGSDGSGMKIAEHLGHTIVEPIPSLVGIETKESFTEDMMGLSLKNVSVTIKSGKKKLYDDFGEMLFTHYGVSGPLILSASSDIGRKLKAGEEMTLFIDLKPALSVQELDDRILRDFKENINKNYENSLGKLLPTAMIPIVVKLSSISPYKKVNEITKEERAKLVELIKAFPLTPSGLRDFNEAIITKGGVSVKEVNPSSMESKLIAGLFFAGEILDVDAYTGGFNLQVAFSTGYLAGLSAVDSINVQ